MSNCVSITELTTASAWIAGLAIVALIAAGWRKPARATAASARAEPSVTRTSPDRGRRDRHRGALPHARVAHACGPSSPAARIAVVTGAVLATFISAAIAYSVVTLTDMLRR